MPKGICNLIHPQAVVDPKAELAPDVEVGPFSYIGPGVEIDSGTVVNPHACIKGPTRIGKRNRIFQFASVGEDCQDKKYKGEPTRLEIEKNDTHLHSRNHNMLLPIIAKIQCNSTKTFILLCKNCPQMTNL